MADQLTVAEFTTFFIIRSDYKSDKFLAVFGTSFSRVPNSLIHLINFENPIDKIDFVTTTTPRNFLQCSPVLSDWRGNDDNCIV